MANPSALARLRAAAAAARDAWKTGQAPKPAFITIPAGHEMPNFAPLRAKAADAAKIASDLSAEAAQLQAALDAIGRR